METAICARLGALVSQQAPKFLSKAPVSGFPLYPHEVARAIRKRQKRDKPVIRSPITAVHGLTELRL